MKNENVNSIEQKNTDSTYGDCPVLLFDCISRRVFSQPFRYGRCLGAGDSWFQYFRYCRLKLPYRRPAERPGTRNRDDPARPDPGGISAFSPGWHSRCTSRNSTAARQTARGGCAAVRRKTTVFRAVCDVLEPGVFPVHNIVATATILVFPFYHIIESSETQGPVDIYITVLCGKRRGGRESPSINC